MCIVINLERCKECFPLGYEKGMNPHIPMGSPKTEPQCQPECRLPRVKPPPVPGRQPGTHSCVDERTAPGPAVGPRQTLRPAPRCRQHLAKVPGDQTETCLALAALTDLPESVTCDNIAL